MSIKCYIWNSGKLFKMGSVGIECSEQMADYLESQTNSKGRIEPIHIPDKDSLLGFRYDNTRKETIGKICEQTQDIGDYLIYNLFNSTDDWSFERKDYDYCYEKTVIKVEDRLVFMKTNEGKNFAIQMNDYLYLKDRPKAKDKVLVCKFLDGKTLVTEIIEKYDEYEHKKRAEEQRQSMRDLWGDDW